jgi:hypothetical protein
MADAVPLCAVVEIEVVPGRVQPVKPFSKPPLTMPPAGATVTVRLTVVLWVALAPVPVTVTA